MTMLYHQVTRQTVQVTIIYYLTNLKHQNMIYFNGCLELYLLFTADILDTLFFGTR